MYKMQDWLTRKMKIQISPIRLKDGRKFRSKLRRCKGTVKGVKCHIFGGRTIFNVEHLLRSRQFSEGKQGEISIQLAKEVGHPTFVYVGAFRCVAGSPPFVTATSRAMLFSPIAEASTVTRTLGAVDVTVSIV